MSDNSPANTIGFVRFSCDGCGLKVAIIGLEAIPEPAVCDACHMEAVRLAICLQGSRPQPIVWLMDSIMDRIAPRSHLDTPEHP